LDSILDYKVVEKSVEYYLVFLDYYYDETGSSVLSVLNYLKRIPKILAGQKFGNYLG
jgi:hypothetical protein